MTAVVVTASIGCPVCGEVFRVTGQVVGGSVVPSEPKAANWQMFEVHVKAHTPFVLDALSTGKPEK